MTNVCIHVFLKSISKISIVNLLCPRLVLEYPAHLLGISKDLLRTKLVSRIIETKSSSQAERIEVTLNVEQAESTLNALQKGLYARLFDYLVEVPDKSFEIVK